MNRDLSKLVKDIKKGYLDSFDMLYDQTKNGVYYMIKSIIKDDSLSQDIMQDTYISFMNNIDNIDGTKSIYSYLLTIAKNKSLNQIKKDANLIGIDYLENMESPEVDNYTPLLDFARSKLSKEEWHILKLTIVDGYRRVEVAKMLKKPVATIN